MTEFQHQPHGNPEQSPTVSDILGPGDTGKGWLGGAVLDGSLYGEDVLQLRFPIRTDRAKEIAQIAGITGRTIGALVEVAMNRLIMELKDAPDWPKLEEAHSKLLPPPRDHYEDVDEK